MVYLLETLHLKYIYFQLVSGRIIEYYVPNYISLPITKNAEKFRITKLVEYDNDV